MALQNSGTISLSQINQELGRAWNAQITLNVYDDGGVHKVQVGGGAVDINQCSTARPNPANADSITEWYSYDHAAQCGGDVYPCTVDCGINATGSTSLVFNYENINGQLFTSEAACINAFSFGVSGVDYQLNINSVYGSSGESLGSGAVPVVGYIIRTGYNDSRKECGYQAWVETSYNPPVNGVYADFYVLATDKRGQVIEKLGPYGKTTAV